MNKFGVKNLLWIKQKDPTSLEGEYHRFLIC